MAISMEKFRELLNKQRQIAFNSFPMRHYFGMMSVEIVDSTDNAEGGYNVWHVPVGGEKSFEAFYKFSQWKEFELDVLRKMHPEAICACSRENECFSTECPVKPA